MIGNRAEVYNRSPLASSSSVAALRADHGERIRAYRRERPVCRSAIQPLAIALIVRPGPIPDWARLFPIVEKIETPSPRDARLRLVWSQVSNCDSHNYLLGISGLENSDCAIQRCRMQNISQRAAILFNIAYWRGRNPIQGIARRVAKMLGKPMLVIGVQDKTTELIPRYGSARTNITGLLRGARVGERIALQQAVDYTRKRADAVAGLPLSGRFPLNIRERR